MIGGTLVSSLSARQPTNFVPAGGDLSAPVRDWQQNAGPGPVWVALRWTHSGLTSVGEMTYIMLAPPVLG